MHLGLRLLAAFALVLALLAGLVTPVFADDRVYLELTVNGVVHEPILVVLRGDDVLLSRADLVRSGVTANDVHGESAFGQEYVPLGALRDRLTYVFDRTALRLDVELAAKALQKYLRDVAPAAPADLTPISARGALVNYGLHTESGSGWSGSFESRINAAPNAVIDMTAVRTADGTLGRGLANLTLDDPRHLRRTVVGDDVVGGVDLGGGALIGGVSVKRAFDENPYIITYPLPSLQATVLQPSRADIYVNGALVKSIDLAPGTYDLENLPLRAGIANAQVVLRNATGVQTLLDSLLYGSSGLLRKGLTDYDYAAGFLRANLDRPDDRYGPAAFSGRYRVGLTNASTVGAHLEATQSVSDGGIEYDGALRLGDVHTAVAISRSGSSTGSAATLAYVSAGSASGFSVLARVQSAAYSTLSLQATDDRVLQSLAAQTTQRIARSISVSVGLQISTYRDAGVLRQLTVATQHRIGEYNLVASYVKSLRTAGTAFSSAGVQLSIGRRIRDREYAALSSEVGSSSGTSFSLQRSASSPLDTRYQINAGATRTSTVGASVQTGLPFAVVGMAATSSGGQPISSQFDVSGSVVRAGSMTLFGQQIPDAYAIVETPGIGGANVLLNNQVVARTNAAGYALVPGLASYQSNAIGISNAGLSLGETLGATDKHVVPEFKGAGFVRYEAHREHGVAGIARIRSKRGEGPASYGQIDIRGADAATFSSPIDADGRFYFVQLAAGTYQALIMDARGARCTTTLTVPTFTGVQVSIGELSCDA